MTLKCPNQKRILKIINTNSTKMVPILWYLRNETKIVDLISLGQPQLEKKSMKITCLLKFNLNIRKRLFKFQIRSLQLIDLKKGKLQLLKPNKADQFRDLKVL